MVKSTLSVKEVADFLSVSITTVYSMVSNNEIPHSKIRGRIIFYYPTIEEWLVNGASKEVNQ